MDHILTDVLVVGGGAAGTRAALEAAKAGARTLLLTKGAVGTAGASAWSGSDAAGFGASGFVDPDDSPVAHLDDILQAGQGMVDPVLAAVVAAEAPRQLLFLQHLGVPIQRVGRSYLATRSCFSSRPRSIKIKGHGKPIVECLHRHLLTLANVRTMEHTMATDPLLDGNGRCLGALTRYGSGQRIAVRAGATILATGGAGQLFELSLNPPDVTGDGYAFGLRAGAELVNLEFMQAGFGILGPRAHAIFQYWLWDLQPILTTKAGDLFLHRFIPAESSLEALMAAKARHFPFSVSDTSRHLEIGVQSFINDERDAGREGEVWMSFTGIEERVRALPEEHNLKRMWSLSREALLSVGVDLTSRFRVAPFAHAMNGGLAIDQFARTTVEGLYAVGETAGGPHGADRLGGNMFPAGQIFAERAGLHAALSAREQAGTHSGESALWSLQDGDTAQEEIAGETVASMRARLQRLASRALLIVRDATALRRFLNDVDEIGGELRGTQPAGSAASTPTVELRNLLLVGKAMATAALLREESRGGHFRKDFPERRELWNHRLRLRLGEREELLGRLG